MVVVLEVIIEEIVFFLKSCLSRNAFVRERFVPLETAGI